METISRDWWLAKFSPAKPGGPVHSLSRDGKTAVRVQRSSRGSRDFHSAVMQLAVFLEQNPKVEQACLILGETHMSRSRLEEEWDASKRVLRNEIARRLGIALVEGGPTWINPETPLLRRIAKAFEESPQSIDPLWHETLRQTPGSKSYEVLKILICRWLQHQGPIGIGTLGEQAGCSYPTIRKTLDKSNLRIAVNVTSNRSVELKAFPRDAWRELVAVSGVVRHTIRFRDRSGEPSAPQALLKRLERLRPPGVAVGGVTAARHWHRDLDLHGTPRLDLTCHCPDGNVDYSFVKTLDSALTPTSDAAVLVIHPLTRAHSLFENEGKPGVPWSDPVETALDLYELSLVTQANQLLTHLRTEVRLA